MRRLLLALGLLAASLPPAPAAADDFDVCMDGGEPRAVVAACTRLIGGGSLEGVYLAGAYINRSSAHRELGDLDAAIADVTVVIDMRLSTNPMLVAATHQIRAAYLTEAGNWPGAIRDWTVVIEASPGDGFALVERARVRLKAGDAGGALRDLRAADALIPDDMDEQREIDALIRQAEAMAN